MTVREAVIKDGNQSVGMKQGLGLALKHAVKNDTDILLVVPTKKQLEMGIILEVLGGEACKILRKGGTVVLRDGGPSITHETVRTFTGLGPGKAVVLACWLDEKAMDMIDDADPPAIVYVAWNEEDGREWQRQWEPPAATNGRPAELDPVVERALQSLTRAVNLGTGLGHPNDEGKAKSTFLILLRAGYGLDGDAVRGWADRNGWRPADARELGALADAISGGKYSSAKIDWWRPDILDTWRNEAAAVQEREKGT